MGAAKGILEREMLPTRKMAGDKILMASIEGMLDSANNDLKAALSFLDGQCCDNSEIFRKLEEQCHRIAGVNNKIMELLIKKRMKAEGVLEKICPPIS